MSTLQHCPGFEQLRNLDSFICKCPDCGEEIEIFSDELNKKHVCPKCSNHIDCAKCPHYLYGRGKSAAAR
jgi:hypothetical protein